MISRHILSFILLLLFTGGHLHAQQKTQQNYKYVLNLSSSVKPSKVISPAIPGSYKTYTVRVKIKGRNWYKIRLGFFADRNSASRVIKKISALYPDAWIDGIRQYDKSHLEKWLVKKNRKISKTESTPKKNNFKKKSGIANKRRTKLTTLTVEKQAALLSSAMQAFVKSNYSQAIRYFTRLYNAGTGKIRQQALEYLGLSRERNQQIAHAIAEYRQYIKEYPLSESKGRVAQRLNALITASKPAKQKLKSSKKLSSTAEWQYYGSLLQFYDKDEIDITGNSSIVAAEQLTTSLSLSGRLRNSDYRMRTDFAMTHGYDVDASETDDSRITSMYLDAISATQNLSIRAGRQRSSSFGALGRFDGFNLGVRVSPQYQLKVLAGLPVEIHPTVEHRDDKYFNSVGFSLGPFNRYWDSNVYIVEQTADNITDRKELGVELRYMHPAHSFINLLDYSMLYDKTNYFVSISNFRFENEANLNIVLDYRRSPYLSTTNALQGQAGVSTLSDLLLLLNEDEIEQLSQDRSALSRSLTVQGVIPHSRDLKYTCDINVSSLSGTVASGGVSATDDTGEEYSYSVGILGYRWLTPYDNYILRLRNSNLSTSDASILDMIAQYRLQTRWKLSPRIRYDTRDYDDGRHVVRQRFSFRTSYRHNRSIQFEMEIATEHKETESLTVSPSTEDDQIIHLGYIYSF